MSAADRKPLVVLAGWLGSQPRLLRRYEALYERAGCRVLCRIAPAHMVIQSVYQAERIQVPKDWLQHQRVHVVPPSMQEMAWEILQCIHHLAPPTVVFHVFSNGGCFVWEQVRNILRESQRDDSLMPAVVKADLRKIRNRVVGVVFDSGPCWGLHRINTALAHCTWKERIELVQKGGLNYLLLGQTGRQDRIRLRNDEFMQSLRNDDWDLPQLYVYSHDDSLCPFDVLDELVRHRRGMLGHDRVWRVTWKSSRHCGHLLQHPKEYQAAVEAFLEACVRGELISKL